MRGWKHWAADALLVEVADVADVQVRESDIQVDNDVDDVTTAPDLTKLSRSWCEHDTLALESVYYAIILRAFLIVVLELCDRCFDCVCENMFSAAHRAHIPSLRTAHHAALAHLAATAPSKLDSREGCLHWWRVLLENFELISGSIPKDMQVLTRKNLRQLSCLDSCWNWSVLAESTLLDSENLPKLSYKQLCRDMELTLMYESAEHGFSLIGLHMHLNSLHFLGTFGTIENPTLVSAIESYELE